MAALGQGINAALGRIDYSPIARGGEAAARGIIGAGQAQAQGMMSLGQGIGAGIQQFQKNRQESAQKEGQVIALTKEMPELFQSLSPKLMKTAEKLRDDGTLGRKELTELHSAVVTAYEGAQAKKKASIEQMIANARLKTAEAGLIGARDRAAAGPEIGPAQRDATAVVQAELAAGTLKQEDAPARFAELLASGGSDPSSPRSQYGGTFIKNDGSGKTVRASLNTGDGTIGYIDADGERVLITPSEWSPISTDDSNLYLDRAAMDKMATEVRTEANGIEALTSYFEGIKDMPTGINKLETRLNTAVKAFMGDEELTDDEMAVGLSQARQQALLGKIRTEVLGPGVLTEIDAQRLLASLGGDLMSVWSQPKIVAQRVYEILKKKHKGYTDLVKRYNPQVVGRYGGMGFSQHEIIPLPQFDAAPEGVDAKWWASISQEERDEFYKLGDK